MSNNINISATTFYLEYKNDIKGWASHSGGVGGTYALNNSDSDTKSYGLEFQSNWRPNDQYMFDLGYTRTESRDGTTCDNILSFALVIGCFVFMYIAMKPIFYGPFGY